MQQSLWKQMKIIMTAKTQMEHERTPGTSWNIASIYPIKLLRKSCPGFLRHHLPLAYWHIINGSSHWTRWCVAIFSNCWNVITLLMTLFEVRIITIFLDLVCTKIPLTVWWEHSLHAGDETPWYSRLLHWNGSNVADRLAKTDNMMFSSDKFCKELVFEESFL